MKKIVLLCWCLCMAFSVGCSNVTLSLENETSSSHPLFSTRADRYALFIAGQGPNGETDWRDWLDQNGLRNVGKVEVNESFEDAKNAYKFLELEEEKEPAFAVFDTQDVVFKTSSESELIEFLKANQPD